MTEYERGLRAALQEVRNERRYWNEVTSPRSWRALSNIEDAIVKLIMELPR